MDGMEELVFTSNTLFIGDGYEALSYRSGAVIQPFVKTDHVSCSRPPVICLNCGGLLNMYCNISENDGRWVCSICSSLNQAFHSFSSGRQDDELQVYPELSFPHVDFTESNFASLNMPVGMSSIDHIRLFAFDTVACTDVDDLMVFLTAALEAIPPSTRVCIMTFGRCINLLCLCGGEADTATVTADVLSGKHDCSAALRHLIRHGEHLTPASNALACVRSIVCGLSCLVEDTVGRKTCTDTTLAVLLGACRTVGAGTMGPGVRAMLITSRSIPLGNTGSLTGEKTTNAMPGLQSLHADLGRGVCLTPPYCWLDVVVTGLHAVEVDLLDALAGASGGCVLGTTYSLAQQELLETVRKAVSLPAACFPLPYECGGTDSKLQPYGGVSIEVRTSKGLIVDQITGPITRIDSPIEGQTILSEVLDEMWGPGPDGAMLPGSKRMVTRLVDREHLKQTLAAISMASKGQASTDIISVDQVDSVRRELLSLSMENDSLCQCMLGRMDPSLALSFVLEPTNTLPAEGYGVVQIVVRYACLGPSGERQRVTRVRTSKLSCTDDVNLYVAQLDEDVWRAVVMRDIVGDMHASADREVASKKEAHSKEDPVLQFLTATESKCQHVLVTMNEASMRLIVLVGVSITGEIDSMVKELTSTLWRGTGGQGGVGSWRDSREGRQKVASLCRSLFHLREGPLLLGPSVVGLIGGAAVVIVLSVCAVVCCCSESTRVVCNAVQVSVLPARLHTVYGSGHSRGVRPCPVPGGCASPLCPTTW